MGRVSTRRAWPWPTRPWRRPTRREADAEGNAGTVGERDRRGVCTRGGTIGSAEEHYNSDEWRWAETSVAEDANRPAWSGCALGEPARPDQGAQAWAGDQCRREDAGWAVDHRCAVLATNDCVEDWRQQPGRALGRLAARC